MKCPKCGYVGFEAVGRCRHCGYDFSLMTASGDAYELLDSPELPSPRTFAPAARAERQAVTPDTLGDATFDAHDVQDLPLRAPTFPALVHEMPPPAARAPLAVRRNAGDRPRSRSVPQIVHRSSTPLLETMPQAAPESTPDTASIEIAPANLRLLAAVIDLAVLAGIDLAVIYLTAQLAGVPVAAVPTLPLMPLAAFLLGLDVAYLAVFTANGGQTLGKMATGLRVEAVVGGISAGDALVRVAVAIVGGLAAGAGFLPALVRADGRALHDLAGQTRVVKVVS